MLVRVDLGRHDVGKRGVMLKAKFILEDKSHPPSLRYRGGTDHEEALRRAGYEVSE